VSGPHEADSLDALRRTLLRDEDGDGFADALAGPVRIATGGGDAAVDASALAALEVLAVVADHALCLPVEVATEPGLVAGFTLGTPATPSSSPPAPPGDAVRAGPEGLSVLADDGAELLERTYAWLDAHRTAEGARAMPIASPSADATAIARGWSEGWRLAPGVSLRGGAPRALAAGVRASLERLDAPARQAAGATVAGLVVDIDPDVAPGTWEVRHDLRGPERRVRIAAADPPALDQACAWFAAHDPRLPDGTWLDDLADRLGRFLAGTSRDGRLAAAAVAVARARADGHAPDAVALRAPPADASRTLGVPVRNAARAGAKRTWSLERAWEGERLLAAADDLLDAVQVPPAADAVRVEAYASESRPVRDRLASRLREAAARRGLEVAAVHVRHAFRPALHWLLEEVVPSLPAGTRRLTIEASRPADGSPEERWLRELYPVAEIIEGRRPDLSVDLRIGGPEPEPRYRAWAADAAGQPRAQYELRPPVADGATPAGGRARRVTGGVRVRRGDAPPLWRRVPTDAETFWSWWVDDVLPDLVSGASGRSDPPLHEIAVVARLSEPDERLDLDHEGDSMLEALHEDVYFGLIEAFERGREEAGSRRVSPGRILPFFHRREEGPLQARVTVRAWADDATTILQDGRPVATGRSSNAQLSGLTVTGRGSEPTGLTVELRGAAEDDGRDGVARLAWAREKRPRSLPAGLPVTVVVEPERAALPPETFPPVPPRPAEEPAPDRPLHPWEVEDHLRRWAAQRPEVRAVVPHETWLGQSLPVMELGTPAGPAASLPRRAAWKPTVLVSARQHANEATSTQAVFAWAQRLVAEAAVLRDANLVVHPIENPDGARLHAALVSVAPWHMHHAARYTAFGADLQSEPVVGGALIAESQLRRTTAERWRPVLHLNDHGYPAHAWIRAMTGFLPAGFEAWSLPVGHLTILASHLRDPGDAAQLREALASTVEAALVVDDEVRDRSRAQVRRRARYRLVDDGPFVYRSGLAFWVEHRPPTGQPDPGALAPLATMITEVPDETVTGAAWHACVRTHVAANEAAARAFLTWWRTSSSRSRPGARTQGAGRSCSGSG
jgi:hypothetical protein